MRFWDSSAIVPLLIDQERSGELHSAARDDAGVVTWWGSSIECVSAIRREERSGAIAADSAQDAIAALDVLAGDATEILPSAQLRSRARRLLGVHDLRAPDACQLAAALVWIEDDADGAGFVCLDRRLSAAAAREGFRVIPGVV